MYKFSCKQNNELLMNYYYLDTLTDNRFMIKNIWIVFLFKSITKNKFQNINWFKLSYKRIFPHQTNFAMFYAKYLTVQFGF